jgi:predicted RNA-binding Zn ribbon-like protein
MAILELQSTRLRWGCPVEVATGKEILEAIQRRAIARWGEKWVAELVKAYVQIAIAKGDAEATVVKRRPQIERAFKTGSCTLDTAIALAAAVGCRFQMACVSVEIEEF